MKKLIIVLSLLILNFSLALDYKYASTKPIEVVKLTRFTNVSQYLNDGYLTIFYTSMPDYVFEDKYKKIADGVFEIKKYKLIFTHKPDFSKEKDMEIIGEYLKNNGQTFVYLDKAPAGYNKILAAAIVLTKAKLDENGRYGLDVAKRKLKVDYTKDNIIENKLKAVKALELEGINVSYVITGDYGLDLIEKTIIYPYEVKDLLNEYWFKYEGDNYTHIYFKPSKLLELMDLNNYDIIGLSYYPLIHLDKAPETFKSDPLGYYYPKSIKYTPNGWEEGPESENNYYYAVRGEPNWNVKEYYTGWYYQGEIVPPENDSKMWEKYRYFSDWYVKNYAYLLGLGCKALYLESSDSYLLSLILGNATGYSKLYNLNVSYLIVPGERGFRIVNNIPIITFPSLYDEKYGATVVNETYIKPDDDFGVYVAEVNKFDTYLLYKLKENGTKIMSFKELANWLERYYKNLIKIKKDNNLINITLKDSRDFKVVIFSNKKIKEVYPNNVTIIKLGNKTIVEGAKEIILG